MPLQIENWRRQERANAGVPTVPSLPVNQIASWLVTDIMIGELYLNTTNGKWYSRWSGGIVGPFLTQADVQAALDALQANIDAEAAARDAADTTLQDNIDAETAARIAAITAAINALKDGVASPGDTLNKLYNLIIGWFTEITVANIAARDAYNVANLPLHIFVQDDGDGKWALYKATTTGVGATFIKISDPDLLAAVMTASQIKIAYESNANTNAFTDALLAKLNGIAANATANSSDAFLLDRANHTGTQLAITISDFTDAVLGTLLTGLSLATNASIVDTDTIIVALGKLQAQIDASAGASSTLDEVLAAGDTTTHDINMNGGEINLNGGSLNFKNGPNGLTLYAVPSSGQKTQQFQDADGTIALVNDVAGVQANLDAEAATRDAADQDLYTKTDDETSDRKAADLALQANIDSLSADLTQEIFDRESDVADLEAADTTLQNNIDDVAADVAQEVTDRANAILALKDGVASPGDTLQKLYNLILSSFTEITVANIAARNAYNVTSGYHVFVTDDGDGNWALYKATTSGTNATYVKLSDPDLLNAVMSASQIKSAYESNADTNAFTNALLAKLNGIATGATANSSDATLLARANHTGTQDAATITGTKTSSFISDFVSTVLSSVLTGLSTATNAVITASDSVLSALGKLQKQISDNLTTLTTHTADTANPHAVTKTQVGLSNVTNNAQEIAANKDATGGYAGLTLFKINFKNVANTFTSFFTNTNTAARTYTFPDNDGTVPVFQRETMADADKTFSAGMTHVAITTAFTAVRTVTLPAANSFPAGTTLRVNDCINAITSSFQLRIARAGSDTINGSSSSFPAWTPNADVLLVTDGSSKWSTGFQNNIVFASGRTTLNSTNTTSEENLTGIKIPAGTLGNNDEIRITCLWTGSGAGTKTPRIRLHTASGTGGTIYSNFATGTLPSGLMYCRIVEKNASNAQEGFLSGTIFGVGGNAIVTSSLSTASDIYINFTSQKATGTDSLSLNNYLIEIIKSS